MKLPRRKFLHLAAGAAALPAVPRIARAQTYPSRPVTIVVPYPAGGLFDAIARVLAEHMRGTLSQTVVIENVGGAGAASPSDVSRVPRRTATRSASAPAINSSSMPPSTHCNTTW
jgi:tripartite-type tricarboxylate transporter receptor subunit TctC